MSIFTKSEVYTIVTDAETNFWVHKFADNHRVPNTGVDVIAAGGVITISFRSRERRSSINEKLKNTFKTVYHVQMGEYLTLITKK